MITSVFSKSKPINFLIVFVITALAFLIIKFEHIEEPISQLFLLKQVLTFIAVYFSILILNFITNKNDLTQKNNLEMLLFSLFLLLIPESLISAPVIWANFFILLALRRLISLRTKKSVHAKLLDAALLIGIASLFYFWAILFFLLIPLLLLFQSSDEIKYWLIPFVGLLAVFVICVSASILINNTYLGFFNGDYSINLDFSAYNSWQYITATTLLLAFGFWSAFYYSASIKMKTRNIRPGFKVVLAALFIALTILIISPKKNGSDYLFLFAPLAIIITNYIEIIKEKWFKETFFSILLLMPFVFLTLHFLAKS